MKYKKRALSILLALTMILTFMPAMAFADVNLAKNETKNIEYATLREAIDNASDGDTISLLADDSASFATDGIHISDSRSLTIKGNNHKLIGSSDYASDPTAHRGFHFTGSGNITIEDLWMTEFGDSYYVNKMTAPIRAETTFTGKLTLNNVKLDKFNRHAMSLKGGSFAIDGCTVICNGTNKPGDQFDHFQQGIEITDDAVGTITNTTITGPSHKTVSGEWNAAAVLNYSSNDISIEDVTIESSDNGIVQNGTGTMTVSGNETNVKAAKKALIEGQGTLSVDGGVYNQDVTEFLDSTKYVVDEIPGDEKEYEVVTKQEKALRDDAAEKGAAVGEAEKALEEAKKTGDPDKILEAAKKLDEAAKAFKEAADKTTAASMKEMAADVAEYAADELKEAQDNKDAADKKAADDKNAKDLADAKADAIAALEATNLNLYIDPERSLVIAAIVDAKAKINGATSIADVKAAKTAADTVIAAQAVYYSKLPKITAKSGSGSKKAITARWKKLSKKNIKKVDGIEVFVAPDKSFTAGSIIKTAKKGASSKKIKGLAKKKTYYVKVRTYKTINGVKFVGKWSKVKKIKTK